VKVTFAVGVIKFPSMSRKRHGDEMSGPEETLAGELRRAIDRAVDVQYIDWRQLPSYMGRLERLLGDIRSFTEGYPAEGVLVLRYFVKAIPRVFDSMADEDELALFCRDLAEVALALASRVVGAVREVAEDLLAAYVADDYGRFSDVPELLVEAELAADVRREVAAMAEALAIQVTRTDSHKSHELGSLAARLR
jgi:HEPN domain-containing protein